MPPWSHPRAARLHSLPLAVACVRLLALAPQAEIMIGIAQIRVGSSSSEIARADLLARNVSAICPCIREAVHQERVIAWGAVDQSNNNSLTWIICAPTAGPTA